MAYLECESHNFHLLYIDYIQQYSIEKCFTSKKLSKKQFPIIIIYVHQSKNPTFDLLFHLCSSIILNEQNLLYKQITIIIIQKMSLNSGETGYNIMLYIVKEVHNTVGEPWLQIIANWVSTKDTNSIRGEPQETNLLGLKSK